MHSDARKTPAIINDTSRPLWSVMIPTYNSNQYLEETLHSITAQDPGPDQMQIEIIDDCSPENTAIDTLKKMGLLDRVSYLKQKDNVGLSRNWNTCIERAQGEVIHILHQDDYVLPGFYKELGAALLQNANLGAAICRCEIFSQTTNESNPNELLQTEPGLLDNWLERITIRNRLMTPAIVVRRSTYEAIGGFHPELKFAVDWEMWIRIAHHFPVWYTPKILATYRNHSRSETKRLTTTAETIRDINRSFSIRKYYLPKDLNLRTEKLARRHYAEFAFRHANRYLDAHKWTQGLMQIYEGLKMSHDLLTIMVLMNKLSGLLIKRIRFHLMRTFNRKPNKLSIRK